MADAKAVSVFSAGAVQDPTVHGVLPFTLLPPSASDSGGADSGKGAALSRVCFMMWLDRKSSLVTSSAHWSECVCEPADGDETVWDTLGRAFSEKSHAVFLPERLAAKHKGQPDKLLDASRKNIVAKLKSGKGVGVLRHHAHGVHVIPVRYATADEINSACKSKGQMAWVEGVELLRFLRSQNATSMKTTDGSTISVYLPFAATLRAEGSMQCLLDVLSDVGVNVGDVSAADEKEDVKEADSSTSEPEASQSQPAAAQTAAEVYSCRMCRRALFTDIHLARHSPQRRRQGQLGFAKKGQQVDGVDSCPSLFLDYENEKTVELLRKSFGASAGVDLELPAGKLMCPNAKCGARLGNWDWSGGQCSCGEWITPFIQVPMTRVDMRVAGAAAPTRTFLPPGVQGLRTRPPVRPASTAAVTSPATTVLSPEAS